MAKFALIRGRVLRVTRLDGCGVPVLGPDSVVVSNGFISVAYTAQTEEGTAISQTNANGDVCILDEPALKFTGYNVEVAFCGVDPDLVRLMTGQAIVTDSAGTVAVGFRMNTQVNLDNAGFALEVWSKVPAGACVGGVVKYGYTLTPFLKGGILGDFTIANDAVNFTLTGAQTKDGTGWGVGPFNVTLGAGGVPAPLKTTMDAYDHLHLELVDVAPPAAVDGATALGVPATSLVAGTPGSSLPSNSYPPASFATIGSITASPATNWTSGQYVVMRNGDKANWNGTAWVAGIHA
jgi:hypothetical protein